MKLSTLAVLAAAIGLSLFQSGCVGYYPYGVYPEPAPPPAPPHATVYRPGVVVVGPPAYYRGGYPYYRNPAGGYYRGPYRGPYGPYHGPYHGPYYRRY